MIKGRIDYINVRTMADYINVRTIAVCYDELNTYLQVNNDCFLIKCRIDSPTLELVVSEVKKEMEKKLHDDILDKVKNIFKLQE